MPVVKFETNNHEALPTPEQENYDYWGPLQLLHQLGVLGLQPGSGEHEKTEAYLAIGRSLTEQAKEFDLSRLEYLQSELVALMETLADYEADYDTTGRRKRRRVKVAQ